MGRQSRGSHISKDVAFGVPDWPKWRSGAWASSAWDGLTEQICGQLMYVDLSVIDGEAMERSMHTCRSSSLHILGEILQYSSVIKDIMRSFHCLIFTLKSYLFNVVSVIMSLLFVIGWRDCAHSKSLTSADQGRGAMRSCNKPCHIHTCSQVPNSYILVLFLSLSLSPHFVRSCLVSNSLRARQEFANPNHLVYFAFASHTFSTMASCTIHRECTAHILHHNSLYFLCVHQWYNFVFKSVQNDAVSSTSCLTITRLPFILSFFFVL